MISPRRIRFGVDSPTAAKGETGEENDDLENGADRAGHGACLVDRLPFRQLLSHIENARVVF